SAARCGLIGRYPFPPRYRNWASGLSLAARRASISFWPLARRPAPRGPPAPASSCAGGHIACIAWPLWLWGGSLLRHAKMMARHRSLRAGFPESFNHRVHRALSWLGRSEAMDGATGKDADTQFILLWIAFNSAYADDRDLSSTTERGAFRKYFE